MKKYGYHGKLTAREGKAEELTAILLEAAKMAVTLKGCQLYYVSKDPASPNDVWVTEVWENKEAHDNSLQVETVRELIAKAMPLLDGMPQKGQELEVLGGTGIV